LRRSRRRCETSWRCQYPVGAVAQGSRLARRARPSARSWCRSRDRGRLQAPAPTSPSTLRPVPEFCRNAFVRRARAWPADPNAARAGSSIESAESSGPAPRERCARRRRGAPEDGPRVHAAGGRPDRSIPRGGERPKARTQGTRHRPPDLRPGGHATRLPSRRDLDAAEAEHLNAKVQAGVGTPPRAPVTRAWREAFLPRRPWPRAPDSDPSGRPARDARARAAGRPCRPYRAATETDWTPVPSPSSSPSALDSVQERSTHQSPGSATPMRS